MLERGFRRRVRRLEGLQETLPVPLPQHRRGKNLPDPKRALVLLLRLGRSKLNYFVSIYFLHKNYIYISCGILTCCNYYKDRKGCYSRHRCRRRRRRRRRRQQRRIGRLRLSHGNEAGQLRGRGSGIGDDRLSHPGGSLLRTCGPLQREEQNPNPPKSH